MKPFKSIKKLSEHKGCREFEISLNELGIPGPDYICTVDLEASAKEANTSSRQKLDSFYF